MVRPRSPFVPALAPGPCTVELAPERQACPLAHAPAPSAHTAALLPTPVGADSPSTVTLKPGGLFSNLGGLGSDAEGGVGAEVDEDLDAQVAAQEAAEVRRRW